MDYLTAGAVLAVIAVPIFAWLSYHAGARRASAGDFDAGEAASGSPRSAQADDSAALDDTRKVIHTLLKGVSANISALLGDSSKYSSALERHEAGIKKAMTIAGIRELERVLLDEIREMQESNARYRSELDEAKATVAEQQAQMEQLRIDVSHDFLTEIPNRRAFEERLAEEAARAKRYGGPLSLVIFDVDKFKVVNDTHGHAAGDRVLRAIAHLLSENKRASDFLARYGGEEFALILPQTPAANAEVMANETRKRIKTANFRFQNATIPVTVSAGAGEMNAGEESIQRFFERVDAALLAAKEQGRDCVMLAQPID